MGRSSGIGQLFKGIIIGVVLILAIIGTMSLFEKMKNTEEVDIMETVSDEPVVISPPRIDVEPTSQTPAAPVERQKTETALLENAKNDQARINQESKKVELGAEKKPLDPSVLSYGLLQVSAVNPDNNEKLTASFVIFNKDNQRVAEIKNVENYAFRLPEGQYKLVAVWSPKKQTERVIKPIESEEYLTVRANDVVEKTIEIKPPLGIGILQISTVNASTGIPLKADYHIFNKKGDVLATRTNVSNSLFKLKSGAYKVTVTKGTKRNDRMVVVDSGISTNEVFELYDVHQLGKVNIRVVNKNNNKPLKADVSILKSTGETIQVLKAVSQTELSLPAGRYTIVVLGEKSQSKKDITLQAGNIITEVFSFGSTPTPLLAPDEVKITDNVTISGVHTSDEKSPDDQDLEQVKDSQTDKNDAVDATTTMTPNDEEKDTQKSLNPSVLTLFSIDKNSEKPLKANFYVQHLNGENVDRKIYADSATFELEPGEYKVTVRATGYTNIVKKIRIVKKQSMNQRFYFVKSDPAVQDKLNQLTQAESNTSDKKVTLSSGFLNIQMMPPQRSYFMVTSRTGQKIAELSNVPAAKFKLDVGQYTVIAVLNNVRHEKQIKVIKNKVVNLRFKVSEFRGVAGINPSPAAIPALGILKSRIVDDLGRPLRGDLVVTSRTGKIVAQSKSVTIGQFKLPAGSYTITLEYNGLVGSERIQITAGKTIIQTFTVANSRQ